MRGRIHKISKGRGVIGITVLVPNENYDPLDLNKMVEVNQLDEKAR